MSSQFPSFLSSSMILFANTPNIGDPLAWAASCPVWRQRAGLDDPLSLFDLGVWDLKGLGTFSVNFPHLDSQGDLAAGLCGSLSLSSFSKFSGSSLHPPLFASPPVSGQVKACCLNQLSQPTCRLPNYWVSGLASLCISRECSEELHIISLPASALRF